MARLNTSAASPTRTGPGIGAGAMLCVLGAALVGLAFYATSYGAYDMSLAQISSVLLGRGSDAQAAVLWQVRLPRIAAAIVTGWGLGLSGLALQTLLRNPLASPFTLGFSHAAALGAALAIVCLDAGTMRASSLHTSAPGQMLLSGPYAITIAAFVTTMGSSLLILVLAQIKKMSPGAVVLVGVALSSLCYSGTALTQYFATETEIAAVLFWTFGDVARSSWQEIGLLLLPVLGATAYFTAHRWSLNALLAGEDTAGSLGVNVERMRLVGMVITALVIAIATAFHGVIGFLGLLAPHISRIITGGNHSLLIPFTCLTGALLLLGADTVGRMVLGSGSLPVGVITSFMGAPLFLYLLIKKQEH